jgi:hypothetical protein
MTGQTVHVVVVVDLALLALSALLAELTPAKCYFFILTERMQLGNQP